MASLFECSYALELCTFIYHRYIHKCVHFDLFQFIKITLRIIK